MHLQLIVVKGPDQGRQFLLQDGQTLTVGRGQASDTKLDDPRMSRVHCRVQVDGEQVLLLCAGGSGGTLVSGSPIKQYPLKPGDQFRIGDTELRYQVGDVDEPRTVDGLNVSGRPRHVPAPLQQLVGTTLHIYQLQRIIGGGSSGMVFEALDTESNAKVAVKVLTPDVTNSDEQKERFVRAMKTMLPIKHPNLVQLRNAGKRGPYCWAAMEYIDGENLMQVIDRMGVSGMLDWKEVWRVGVHVGRALQESYQHKIIHRNVTPTNILRRSHDKVCLLGDLMLAKALEGTMAKQVTQPGQLIGDLPYMAPERTREAQRPDHRADLYGLGATLYALLTGRPPFESNSLPELVRQIRSDAPRAPRDFQMSTNDNFAGAVLKTLAKAPEDRFQTPAEFLRELERIGRFGGLEADWSAWSG